MRIIVPKPGFKTCGKEKQGETVKCTLKTWVKCQNVIYNK